MANIQGTFKDIYDQETYTVTIEYPAGISHSITDPTEHSNNNLGEIYFSPDPVHITCDRSDLTQLIMISQAKLRLKTNDYLMDYILASTNRDIKVKIERTNSTVSESALGTVFYGYIDPLQFNQGLANKYEEVVINATDPLGILMDLTIDDLDVSPGDVISVLQLIKKIIARCFLDDSTAYTGLAAKLNSIQKIAYITVNTSVFFGDDPDDYMTLYDTLLELLKYTGIMISYEPKSKHVILSSLYSTSTVGYTTPWFDTKTDILDTSINMSVDDAYSQVRLTCEIEPTKSEISLVDDDWLYSDYRNYQKYMTELISLGEGSSAYNGFAELLTSANGQEATDYDGGYKIDNYCYVKRNDAWDFGPNSYITAMGGTDGENIKPMTNTDQSRVLKWLKDNPIKAAFVSFGRAPKVNKKNNSPVNNIDMKDYFVISICGHDDHTGNHNVQMCNVIQSNSPLCKYTGLSSTNLIPNDPSITNYIVISGKIVLNPLQPKTGLFWDNTYERSTNSYLLTKSFLNSSDGLFNWLALWHKTVGYDGNDDGAYYQHKWWKCTNPVNPSYTLTEETGIFGYLDNKSNEKLKYTYTSYDNNNDEISKLPILACQLKVGDKYCVERLDLGPSGEGKFQWMTMEQWNASPLYTKGYEKPYFTIGIDPAPDDNIVGHSFDIQSNIKYTMNVEGKGTAIPIKSSDKLNGVPEFTILGPINSMWNEIERIHPSFWRHTSWNDHKYWVLEMLDSILISDFKIEFESDNALVSTDMTTADNDLVYYSDTNPLYMTPLEDDIKICTPLTMDECLDYGIKYQISNSYVMTLDGEPFYGWIYDSQDNPIKNEQLLVDYLYKQYKEPAIIVDMNVDNGDVFGARLLDIDANLGISTLISIGILNMNINGASADNSAKDYYIMSIDWSPKTRSNNMKCREKLEYTIPS